MKFRKTLFALLMASTGAVAQTASAPVTTQLPRNARPVHYNIRFVPDAAKLSFAGNVAIDVDVVQPSKSITLNATDLAFRKVTIKSGKGTPIAARASVNAAQQTATFVFPRALPRGRYTINADYSGKIFEQPNGLFVLDYKDDGGAPKRALVTQFEAPDARRFVPSWDEPNYKATFDLTAIVPHDQMAVSNMPVAARKALGNGTDEVAFRRSPKMSTYLLFFSAGEFDRITTMQGPTEIGVVAAKGAAEKGRYVLDASAKIVGYYNDYFGTPYPLPKLDNIAGPGQSQFFSAMENWGAIMSFERYLLVDPKQTSAGDQQDIFETAAHEIAHQWFGNLVTMQWWDDLWLNEGFASWMARKTSAHFNPEWQAELGRVQGRERAMALDGYKTTHPIIQTIKTVEQTNQAFDSITYQKGEAVIAMLEGFAGADVWRDGIRRYMKTHAYGNTRTDDLWNAVEAAGAKGLVTIAHDFTKLPGVPLIRVKSAVCTGGTTQLTLEQGEFSRDAKARADVSPLRWHVPVIAQTVGNAPTRGIIADGAGTMALQGCGPVIVNAGQSGYYRVLYTPENIGGLKTDFAKLPAIDQLGVINDGLRLSFAEYQPMAPVLDLIGAVPADANAVVLQDVVQTTTVQLDRFRDDPATQLRLGKLLSQRWGARLQQLGMAPKAGERLVDSTLRTTLIAALGHLGDPTVLAEARRLFAALDTNPAALDGPLRTTWLATIADHADRQTWNKLHEMAKRTDGFVAKSSLYALLGGTRDKTLAGEALKLALTSEPGKTISPDIIAAVAAKHPDLAFDFAVANHDAVMALVDATSRSEFVSILGRGSSDPAMLGKLEAYAKAHLTPESRKPADQSIASIRTRIATEPRIKAGVIEWLGRNGV